MVLNSRHVKSPENGGRVMEKQLFSCLMKFKKKSPEKTKILTLVWNFLKGYACKLKKPCLDPKYSKYQSEVIQSEVVQISIECVYLLWLNRGNVSVMKNKASWCSNCGIALSKMAKRWAAPGLCSLKKRVKITVTLQPFLTILKKKTC